MTRDEFDQVTARMMELWIGRLFWQKINSPAIQTVLFKKLSTFRVDEVLEQLEHHKYDNTDAREPKFNEIAAKLWAIRRTREGQDAQKEAAQFPSWPTIEGWAGRKSDGDLDHLWQIVTQRYEAVANEHDKLWPLLNSCDRRSTPCLTIAWAVEHNVELTFKRGTDEWFVVMDMHDRLERHKSVVEQEKRKANAA